MPPLVSMRYPADAMVDDLLWPDITAESQVRLEPGEVVSWRGSAQLVEVRLGSDKKMERVWKLTESAEYTITNRRIFYLDKDIERGTGRLGKIAWCLYQPEPDSRSAIAAGQVRFQWPAVVRVEASSEATAGVSLVCSDGRIGDEYIEAHLVLIFRGRGGMSARSIATNVASLLVSDIARFRLEARAGQLKPEHVEQLSMQRDNPTPVGTASLLRWPLTAGLIIGQPARLSSDHSTDPRLDKLSNDAQSSMERYMQRGRIEDLERALRLARSLLNDAPPNSPNRLLYENLYAGALRLRYDHFGDLSDLTAAIDAMRQTAKRTELEEKQWLPTVLRNLGDILVERWKRALNEHDLTQGIAALEAIVAAIPHDSDKWAPCASALANALCLRYPVTGEMADLDRAVELCQETLDRVPRRSPDRGGYFANLGNSLLFRHNINNSQDDLARAIDSFQTALVLMPRRAPSRSVVQMALADATNRMAGRIRSASSRAAVKAWRKTCSEGEAGSPTRLLQAAANWSRAMIQAGDWAVAVEACNYGLTAVDRLFRLQLTREHKGLWLEEARELPARAAYAYAKLGELPQAVVALERGRAIFLAEALARNRADLDQLTLLGLGDLRQRYQHAVDRLVNLERAAENNGSAENRNKPLTAPTESVRQARAELDHAIRAIRAVEGYENFLTYPTYHEITSTATTSPLVYISAIEIGGFALVVDGRNGDHATPTVIWLDELNETGLTEVVTQYLAGYERQLRQGSRQHWAEALDAVTRRLWDIVIGPVLSAVPADRFILLPGDMLAILPLHAAWAEDASMPIGRRYALDDALITYAPSARALQFVQKDAGQRASDSILAIYDTSLTASEFEVHAVSRWFPHVQHLCRDQTTLEMVRTALSQYSVLHFSCHGSADIADPLASYLAVAYDGNLTLRDILKQRLYRTRLAVLSACETALIGSDIPEEVVGLPSGLLQAGATGVLGSLWPVVDDVTAALMVRFYELWREAELDPAEALRQAQQWVRDECTSSAGIQRSEIICTGRNAHVHPTHWAAFTYMGL